MWVTFNERYLLLLLLPLPLLLSLKMVFLGLLFANSKGVRVGALA